MLRLSKVFFLLLIIFAISPKTQSQTAETDSLKRLINLNVSDTATIKNCLALARLCVYTKPDSAKYFAEKALTIAQKNDFLVDMAASYTLIGLSNSLNTDYYDGLSSLAKALKISEQLLEDEPNNKIHKRNKSKIYIWLGHIYYFQGKHDLALNNFFSAMKLLNNIDDEHGVGTCLSNISVVYETLDDYQKAIKYNHKSLEIAKKNNDRELLSLISNNLCVDYIRLPNYDSAYFYITKCIEINKHDNNEFDLQTNYVNLARIYSKKQIYDSALLYFNMSMEISKQLNSIVGIIDVNHLMGEVYLNKKDYIKAENHFKKSLKLAQEAGITNSVKNAHNLLSDVYKAKGDYKKAYEYYVVGSQIGDSIFNEESDARIADMEIKYQSEKKEEEIKLLQETAKLNEATSKTNRIIFSAVIVILVLVIILVIMSYRSYKHKQLAEQIKTKQNAERKMLDAVIETEYKERKRFAEDLHDSLGVLLSTLRLYVNEIDNNTTSDERKELIEQSNGLLDDAIANARNISNNIMPAALKNNGLEIAIRSFCDKINSSGNIKIEVQSINFKKHHKNTLEVSLYRILTEMVNNTLKHAEATEVNISLTEKANKLFVTYTDNGKGFDYEAMLNSEEKGMGLDNTISRINSIGGICTIKSSVGKGYFANIKLDV